MTSKSGRHEESAQFSLQELLKLEDERLAEVRRENEELEALEAATVRRRAEAAERERLGADARERADAEARHNDLARREAMQKAVVEQSRLEVEVRARAHERERERHHEIEVERLRGEARRGGLGALAAACAFGGIVMLVVSVGVHFGVTKPAADRRVAELEHVGSVAESRGAELQRRLDEQRGGIESLERKLETAAAEIRILKERPPTRTAPTGPAALGGRTAPAPAPAPAPGPTCLKGDPMCPTVGR